MESIPAVPLEDAILPDNPQRNLLAPWNLLHHPFPPPFPPLARLRLDQVTHLPHVKVIDALPDLVDPRPVAIGQWFRGFPILTWQSSFRIGNALLIGKPVISAFMGISEKTLKRWMHKYEELPVFRGGYRCAAVTTHLLLWKVWRELEAAPESHYHAARARTIADLAYTMGISEKMVINSYVKRDMDGSVTGVPYIRIRRPPHRRKTVEKLLETIQLYQHLKQGIFL